MHPEKPVLDELIFEVFERFAHHQFGLVFDVEDRIIAICLYANDIRYGNDVHATLHRKGQLCFHSIACQLSLFLHPGDSLLHIHRR